MGLQFNELRNTERELGVKKWGDSFCPSVLAAARSTSASSQSSPQSTSAEAATATTSVDKPSSTSSINAATLGAGTPGTNWGSIKQSSSANRGPALEAVSIILICITAMILAVRIFARIYTKRSRQAVKGVWWDEWFALAALVFTGGVTADIIVGTGYGIGKHLPAETTIGELQSIIKIVYAFVAIVSASFATLKISILCLYLRMTPERYHKITIYICLGFVATHTIAAEIVSYSNLTNRSRSSSLGCSICVHSNP